MKTGWHHSVAALMTVAALAVACSPMPVDIRQENAWNLRRLEPGMTLREVHGVMGTDTETVRENIYNEQKLVGHIDLIVSNPYRSEIAETDEGRLDILYYYAMPGGMGLGYWDTYFDSGTVPDWCLTPVILKNGRLVGLGAELLEELGLTDPSPGSREDQSILVGS